MPYPDVLGGVLHLTDLINLIIPIISTIMQHQNPDVLSH